MAKHLVQVGECMDRAGAGTDEQLIAMYEEAKAMYDREYGEGHLSTARCLVGIGERYMADWEGTDYQKALDCGRAAPPSRSFWPKKCRGCAAEACGSIPRRQNCSRSR